MKISFVIPVYNSGELLNEAISSILDNSLQNHELEILLIDDCSTQTETQDILSDWAQHSSVKLIRQLTNGGPSKARNAGIRQASGEWISFLDADDILSISILQHRLSVISEYPDCQWIAGDFLEIKTKGNASHTNLYPDLTKNCDEVLPGVFKISNATERLVGGFPPLLGSMMIHRELLERTGLLNENLIYGEDFLFALVLSSQTPLFWLSTPGFQLRRYHESLTKNRLRAAREAYKADLEAYKDVRLRSVRKQIRWHLSGVLRVAAHIFMEHGLWRESIKAGAMALFWSPNDMRNFISLRNAFIKRS